MNMLWMYHKLFVNSRADVNINNQIPTFVSCSHKYLLQFNKKNKITLSKNT